MVAVRRRGRATVRLRVGRCDTGDVGARVDVVGHAVLVLVGRAAVQVVTLVERAGDRRARVELVRDAVLVAVGRRGRFGDGRVPLETESMRKLGAPGASPGLKDVPAPALMFTSSIW